MNTSHIHLLGEISLPLVELTQRFIRPMPINPVYLQRVQKELNLIEEKGFVKCFSQVAEIVEYSRYQGIPHLLRGSGASSLVSYLLGITNIDPIKENILLSRFMNEYRNDQPDIDIDYPHWIRDSIMDEMKRRYPQRVARISNDVKFQAKSALREILKRHGVKGKIPKWFSVEDYFTDPVQVAEIHAEAEELIGQHRYWSLHCGGIIVFDDRIPEDLILKNNQISLTKDDVEERGLIKIDLLCNRGLSQLWEIDERPLDEYPLYDKKIIDLLSSGDVIGLTQAESRTMKKTFQALKPQNYQEVALALALIRPAAADNGRKSAYFKDPKNTKMLIYDDDAIAFIADTVGCSLAKADKYRRAFKKGDTGLITDFLKKSAGKTTWQQQGMQQLRESDKYSFCKGHALAYGQMVWALAFHKVYNKKRFWQSTIKHCKSSYRRWVHKAEAQQVGITMPHPLCGDSSTYQLLKKGWWSGDFPDDCYLREVDGVYEFRGIVASKRNLRRNKRYVRLVTIGYAPGKYVDLVIVGKIWVRDQFVITGKGKMVTQHNSEHIEVESMTYKPYNIEDHDRQLKLF